MSSINPRVDVFMKHAQDWQEELAELRSLILKSGLTEELKWGQPCYTDEGKNIVLIHGFKNYCGLMFFKGALLADPQKVLIQQTPNVQLARQMRFTNLGEIIKKRSLIKRYIKEAKDVERLGLSIPQRETTDYPVPSEFQDVLSSRPKIATAFAALTPGRQRGYLLYFASAKQAATRSARVEKCLDAILAGRGLNDPDEKR